MVLVRLFHFRELNKAGERQKNVNISAAIFHCLSAMWYLAEPLVIRSQSRRNSVNWAPSKTFHS